MHYIKSSKPYHPYGNVPTISSSHFLGYHKDTYDKRDWRYKIYKKAKALPSVDLRKFCPPVSDQSSLGSCTSFAVSSAHMFGQKKQGAKTVMLPSRLFLYYNIRLLEGTVSYDSGGSIRNGFKGINKWGVCPETMWKYVIQRYKTKPTNQTYAEAMRHQTVQYFRLNQSLAEMKNCISSGYPFVFGFNVYPSFLTSSVARTGTANLPGKRERILGGHAVTCVGFTDATQRFTCLNSWGKAWGASGYFTLPYKYLANSNLADDFWTMRLVEI